MVANNVTEAKPRSRFTPPYWVFAGLLAGAMMECVGGYYDVWFHVHLGRETFWTLPHMILYSGAFVLGIFGGIGGVMALRALRTELRAAGRKFSPLMVFAVPIGYVIIVAGITAQIASAPFDDAWHVMLKAQGRPDVFYTPPHLMATIGGLLAFVGVLVEAVRVQRLHLGPGALGNGPRLSSDANRQDVVILLSVGAVWLGLTFLFVPIDFPRGWVTLRGALVQGGFFGLAAVLARRLTRLPMAATLASVPFIVVHSVFRDGLLFFPAYLGAVLVFDLVAHLAKRRRLAWALPVSALAGAALLGALLILTPLPGGSFASWEEMSATSGLSLSELQALEQRPLLSMALSALACAATGLVGALIGMYATRSASSGAPSGETGPANA